MGQPGEVDIRQPSINTEPRTLSESTIQKAKEAAEEAMQQHPDPKSDIFTKDASDLLIRHNESKSQAHEGDALAGPTE